MKKERADGKKVSETLGKIAGDTSTKAKSVFVKSKESVINAIDANGNGEIDIEDIIIIGLRTPGIRVNRSDFLRKELMKKYPQNVIEDAVAYNPAHAQIPAKEVDKIADEVIQFERTCVAGISTALGCPRRRGDGRNNSSGYWSVLRLPVKGHAKAPLSLWVP